MKWLGFRASFLSTEEKAEEGTKLSQPTERQVFYIVCYTKTIFDKSLIFEGNN